jgi:hypothetical protein
VRAGELVQSDPIGAEFGLACARLGVVNPGHRASPARHEPAQCAARPGTARPDEARRFFGPGQGGPRVGKRKKARHEEISCRPGGPKARRREVEARA